MPSVGDEFDGYRIDGVLGSGGMGTVYAATDLQLKREVAIKVLSRELSSDVRFTDRFRREAEIQANLEHPHIVAVHAFGAVEGELYLVMRRIRGHPLSKLLDRGLVTRCRSLQLLEQVAQALDSAHEVGLVHRDVKPDNILISNKEVAYLADFGLTRSLTDDAGLTRSGAFVGTVKYVSPEQATGLALTAAADIYSLTVVLFECMTGQVPYLRDTHIAILLAHTQDAIPSACALNDTLPAALDGVIEAGMAKDPADRPASAVKLIELAKSALAAAPTATIHGRTHAPTPIVSDPSDRTRDRLSIASPPASIGPSDVDTPLLGSKASPDSPRHPGRGPDGTSSANTRRRRAAARVALAIALAASLAAGLVLGNPADEPRTAVAMTARNSAMSLTYSDPWVPASSAAPTPGLALKHRVALRGADGLSLVAGVAPTSAATLLPRAMTRRLPGEVTTEDRVMIGNAEGVRYSDLALTGSVTHMSLVAVPRTGDVVYVVCTRPGALTERDHEACYEVISTLRIAKGALALAPRAAYANAVAEAVSAYTRARAALVRKVKRADRRISQATALTAFSATCRSRTSALRAAPAGPQEAGFQRAIEAAADNVCSAYRMLASAAKRNDRVAYDRARAAAAQAQRALRMSVDALARLGYQVKNRRKA